MCAVCSVTEFGCGHGPVAVYQTAISDEYQFPSLLGNLHCRHLCHIVAQLIDLAFPDYVYSIPLQ